MRCRVWLAVAYGIGALGLCGGLSGCGGSIKEGVPTNVDMSKNYAPTIDMPGMSPKAASKANAAPKP